MGTWEHCSKKCPKVPIVPKNAKKFKKVSNKAKKMSKMAKSAKKAQQVLTSATICTHGEIQFLPYPGFFTFSSYRNLICTNSLLKNKRHWKNCCFWKGEEVSGSHIHTLGAQLWSYAGVVKIAVENEENCLEKNGIINVGWHYFLFKSVWDYRLNFNTYCAVP